MPNSPDLTKLNTQSIHTLEMLKHWICSLTCVFIKPSRRPLYYRKQHPEEVLLISVCVTQSTLKATLLARFLPRSLHFPFSKSRQCPQTSESVFKQQSAVWLCSRPRERSSSSVLWCSKESFNQLLIKVCVSNSKTLPPLLAPLITEGFFFFFGSSGWDFNTVIVKRTISQECFNKQALWARVISQNGCICGWNLWWEHDNGRLASITEV